MKATKKINESGITLVALVVTMIILMILASVTINVILGEGGLIQSAQKAKNLSEQTALKEEQELNELMAEFTNLMAEDSAIPEPPKGPETVEDARPNPGEDGIKFEDTTTIKDDLDNLVTIPGGFHLDEDSGTKVEEGIVIEDDSGNQFVWIPVGEYNVSNTISSTGKLNNILSRRNFSSTEATSVTADNGNGLIGNYFYGEGDSRAVQTHIEDLKSSTKPISEGGYGGFYIGRYEQGEGNICKANVTPSVNYTRNEAKSLADSMYSGNKYVTSELISSYAWDTALNFICQTNEAGYLLANTTSSTYGNISTGNPTKTGEYEADEYSKIHDMLGNRIEWTTEYSNRIFGTAYSNVNRGGRYYDNSGYASLRNATSVSSTSDTIGYRVQLIINNANS